MDPRTFERVAARFERLSRTHPRRYRLFVAALGAAGLAVVWLWIAASLALLAAVGLAAASGATVLLVPLGLAAAAFCLVLVRATRLELPRPPGVAVTAAEVPRLFEELDRLRALGRVPRLHRVLLGDRLEAGVWQTPRLGLLGWPHNDLVLGYPLLAALSPEETRAVLAHELAHLSRRHGRADAWVYRVRTTWAQLVAALEAWHGALAWPLRRCLALYGPWFSAASLALARAQERDADRFAALATSPRAAADALLATRLAHAALEQRYLPAFRRASTWQPRPPEDHLAAMTTALLRGMADAGAREALRRALLERSGPRDTHPSLPERLAALGEAPRFPPRPARSAAEELLGEALPRIRAELERRWRVHVATRWTEAHASAHGQSARLAALEELAGLIAPSADELLERTMLVEELRGPEEAVPVARAAVERAPELAPTHFLLGRLLLAAGDPEGFTHLERAMAFDPGFALPAARLMAAYHASQEGLPSLRERTVHGPRT